MISLALTNAQAGRAGQEDLEFDSGFAQVRAMTRLRSGQLILAGANMTVPPEATSRELVSIGPNGAIDTSFAAGKAEQAGQAGSVDGVIELSDDRLFVFGTFSTFGGHVTFGLARLHADGAADTTFEMPEVEALDVIGGSPQSGLAIKYRTESGDIAAGIVPPGASSLGDLIALDELAEYTEVQFQSDGAIVGLADSLRSIRRLLSDGSIDPAFEIPVSPEGIQGFKVIEDDSILVWPSPIDEIATLGMVKLLPNGMLDTTFNPVATAELISVLPDGRLLAYVGERVLTILDANGNVDKGFTSRPNFDIVEATVDDNGDILALLPEFDGQGKLIRLLGKSDPLEAPLLTGRAIGTGLTHLSWSGVEGAVTYIVEQSVDGWVSGQKDVK